MAFKYYHHMNEDEKKNWIQNEQKNTNFDNFKKLINSASVFFSLN